MARIHHVTRSNKEHVCGMGHTIPKGEPYTWAKPGFRTRTPKIRCLDHPFRPSDLATGLNAEPLAAQEAFDDALRDLEQYDYDGLEAAVEEFRSALEEYRDARQEGLDAWENGNSQFEEWVDQAEEAVSALENVEVEPFDEEEPEKPDPEDEEAYEAYEAWDLEHLDWESRRDSHWEDALAAAEAASSEVSL